MSTTAMDASTKVKQMSGSRSSSSFALMRHVRWEHLLAGISGGVLSTLVLHPLDLVKIRFQVNEGYGVAKRPQYQGITHAFRSIVWTSGLSGLYQGVIPNIWGAGASWGLYFFFYNSIKTWMQDGNSKLDLGPTKHMLAASEAGLMTLILTNPIWVTKTRLCLQYERSMDHPGGKMYYTGMFDALKKIYKMEGLRGLYKGFIPGAFGVSHGAIQFMVYEELKTTYNNYFEQSLDVRLSSLEYVTFAAISKIVAATSTYPYQVVRSRLQDQHREYSGVVDVIRQTWKFEGAYGFYKGLFASLLRVTPACCITFVVYEAMISILMET